MKVTREIEKTKNKVFKIVSKKGSKKAKQCKELHEHNRLRAYQYKYMQNESTRIILI